MSGSLSSSATVISQEYVKNHRHGRRGSCRTRVYWSPHPEWNYTLWTPRELYRAWQDFSRTYAGYAICVIENITTIWANKIEASMRMDPQFFENHFTRYWDTEPQDFEEEQQWRSIDGKYSLGDQRRTRISYYRLEERLYIFLVDSPPTGITIQQAQSTPREPRGRNRMSLLLKYPCPDATRGLHLPALFDPVHATFDLYSLIIALLSKDKWRLKCLCVDTQTPRGHPSVIRVHPMVYMLADAAWAHNLRYLTEKVRDASFGNVEKPHRDVLLVLHALREDLVYLRFEIETAARYVPFTSMYCWRTSVSGRPDQTDCAPGLHFDQMRYDAAVLDGFLTDSLSLLVASIMLRDSDRAGMLMWLASVFLPLTFVTGIFGMNVQELNDTGRPVWLCFEVLGVVLLVVAAMVLWYKYGGRVMAHLLDGRGVDPNCEQFSGHPESQYRPKT